ncbi:MAG: peptidoglycan bridge formation glycyltransferase FemA/FemB family protein [Treponema sp.]|jgi:lipid II:glycine glycyltransferase (peptidoglycan interpeptide bridge formation enzyme)|nr:peptidoglycan bridge formation glycyltransferase FemA/FemB family protein [Treponema sp.]
MFIKDIAGADLAVCGGADSFLQSAEWGRFKGRFGWESRAFIVLWAGFGERPLLVLTRRLAPCVTMAYVPWGPELPASFPADGLQRNGALAELAAKLRLLLPGDTAFIRFDPPWYGRAGEQPEPFEKPLCRAAADIQPPDTVLINLDQSPEAILAGMKPKWRYNIGLAEKRGVTVTMNGGETIEIFYRLLVETAARDGIAIHGIGYYQTLFEVCHDSGAAEFRLYTARHEDDTLAAIVTLFRGTQAVYLYGASSNVKRNLMAPYALQWRAMLDAQSRGCSTYDLFGIPPSDDSNHPMAGLYRFKTGFGGTVVHRSGSWDYPCRPVLYGMFSAAEKLRKQMRDSRKKRR